MKIAAYCRVSTDKADQLNSLETQKAFFREYAERSGHTLVCVYADEGISGTRLKSRTQFRQMLLDAESGMFELLAVKDVSRFARNTVDFLRSIRHLKSLGVETQFITANMTNMGDSEFILTIFAALAQEESANTSKRIKFTKRINAEKGRVPNLVFGYDKIKGEYFDLRINQREAEIVREIYRMYVCDGLGTCRIAGDLNRKGYTTKRGYPWSQEAVARILSNELYIGTIVNGKEEVADFLTGRRIQREPSQWYVTDRPDLRIIDPGMFDQARRLRQERSARRSSAGERHSSRHLFSTLIKCSVCGSSFRRIVRNGGSPSVQWTCTARNLRGAAACCNAVRVDEAVLTEALNEYFSELLGDRETLAKRITRALSGTEASGGSDPARRKDLSDRLAQLRRTRQKYLDLYADDLISRRDLETLIGGSGTEIQSIEQELQALSRNSESSVCTAVPESSNPLPDTDLDVGALSNTQLRQVIERITVSPEGRVSVCLKRFGTAAPERSGPIPHNGT
ncbi:MAG: recombinase family protein [Oscillospiraceae bacterium]|nr:recombinase family protein [Oscillospiraceae bacterium]